MAEGKKTGGRVKGTPNKFTASVKEAVLLAFQELQDDETTKLTAWGKKNTTEFYKIAAKLIPTEVKASVEGTINHFIIEPDAGCDPIKD